MNNIKNKGFVLWFSGLSASGKTTIADGVIKELNNKGTQFERLDGDLARENLTRDLGFSPKDRDENIRRIAFVSDLLSRNGIGVIASFITPYLRQRKELRKRVNNYIEVFVDAPLSLCEKRDPKGMYRRARAGELKNFTGIDDVYEAPQSPDIHILSGEQTVAESVESVMVYLRERGFIF